MENNYLTTILLSIPLAGAILLLFVPSRREFIIKIAGLVISTIAFILSLLIYTDFDPLKQEFQFVDKLPWIESLNITFFVGIDGLSILLVLLTTFLTPLTLLSSWSSIKHKVKEFTFFMLILEVGMLGVFVSLDIFLFYIFWEAMLIPMYFIIGIWGGSRRIYASVKFFIYTMFGSLLMLVAMIWIAVYASGITGSFTTNLLDLYKVGPEIPKQIQSFMFLAFALASQSKYRFFHCTPGFRMHTLKHLLL